MVPSSLRDASGLGTRLGRLRWWITCSLCGHYSFADARNGVIGMRVSPGIVFPAHISLGMRVSPLIYH